MKKSFKINYTIDDLKNTPDEDTLEVLFYQSELFRFKVDKLRNIRKKTFVPAAMILSIMSLFLFGSSILILVISSSVDSQMPLNNILSIIGIFVSILGLVMGIISIIIEKMRWENFRKKIYQIILKIRFRFFKLGLRRKLPYEIEFIFTEDKIINKIPKRDIEKTLDVNIYKRIVQVPSAYLFFQRKFSPNYKFTIPYRNEQQKNIVLNFLESSNKKVIDHQDLISEISNQLDW